MTKLLDSALVLCDLDHLLLAGDGNMPQVVRDVLQLFSSRGGRLTVFPAIWFPMEIISWRLLYRRRWIWCLRM